MIQGGAKYKAHLGVHREDRRGVNSPTGDRKRPGKLPLSSVGLLSEPLSKGPELPAPNSCTVIPLPSLPITSSLPTSFDPATRPPNSPFSLFGMSSLPTLLPSLPLLTPPLPNRYRLLLLLQTWIELVEPLRARSLPDSVPSTGYTCIICYPRKAVAVGREKLI